MRSVSPLRRLCAAAIVTTGLAAPAGAELQLDGSATLVSDYRYRGMSLSEGSPAIQGGLELSNENWFGGGWASTTRETSGAGTEVDLYAGRRGTIRGLHYALAGYLYLDPARGSMNYAELQTRLDRSFGHADLELEAWIAPKQAHFEQANLYVAAGLSVPSPVPNVSLSVHGGYESGSWRHKADWDVGTDYRHSALRIGAHLIGASAQCPETAKIHARGTALVGSIRFEL